VQAVNFGNETVVKADMNAKVYPHVLIFVRFGKSKALKAMQRKKVCPALVINVKFGRDNEERSEHP
jgi:hypothetical protein